LLTNAVWRSGADANNVAELFMRNTNLV